MQISIALIIKFNFSFIKRELFFPINLKNMMNLIEEIDAEKNEQNYIHI